MSQEASTGPNRVFTQSVPSKREKEGLEGIDQSSIDALRQNADRMEKMANEIHDLPKSERNPKLYSHLQSEAQGKRDAANIDQEILNKAAK